MKNTQIMFKQLEKCAGFPPLSATARHLTDMEDISLATRALSSLMDLYSPRMALFSWARARNNIFHFCWSTPSLTNVPQTFSIGHTSENLGYCTSWSNLLLKQSLTAANAAAHLWIEAGSSCQMREGVQSSSNSNHRHPNLFCGKRAPQLVISTTSISNHRKMLFSVIWI